MSAHSLLFSIMLLKTPLFSNIYTKVLCNWVPCYQSPCLCFSAAISLCPGQCLPWNTAELGMAFFWLHPSKAPNSLPPGRAGQDTPSNLSASPSTGWAKAPLLGALQGDKSHVSYGLSPVWGWKEAEWGTVESFSLALEEFHFNVENFYSHKSQTWVCVWQHWI